MTSTNPTTPDQGDERRAFEQHIQATEQRKALLWSQVWANSMQDGPMPAHMEGKYLIDADQKAWLAWQAARALSAAQPVAQEAKNLLEDARTALAAMFNTAGPDSEIYRRNRLAANGAAEAVIRRIDAALAAPQPSQGAECTLCAGRGFYGTPGARCDWCKGTGKAIPAPHPPASAEASKPESVADEPFAYYVYIPAEQRGEFVHDLDDAIDDLTNCECEVSKLYLRPTQQGGEVSDEREEDAYVIQRISTLLAQIAVIVRGQEPPRRRWGYSDLPERVLEMLNDRDALMVALRNLVTSIKERHNLDEAIIWAEEAISKSAARAVLSLVGSGGKA